MATEVVAAAGINIDALQKLVLQIAGLGIAGGGLLLAFRGMTRHFAEAITGLVGFIVGLAVIGVGFFSESGLKNLATGLANLIFTK
ncbi:hypothetical protein ACFY4C_40515 [Actinomadura viridis]|uniref:hypothetical protein n=1 Tax=Actinomadura viridis TaxID=58110 RepID=UPI003690ADA3